MKSDGMSSPSSAPLRVSVSLCETVQTVVTTYPLLSCGTNITRYVWGLDISGQSGGRASSQAEMQGAGGIGGLCAVFPDNGITPHYPAYDANGNITEYVDFIGNTIAHYEYDAFGNFTGQSGSMADDFKHRFSTKYLDVETGLYYYGRIRYYSPPLGRFISRDPIGERGGLNLYGFCGNDPVNRVDFVGLRPLGPADIAIINKLENLADKSEKNNSDFSKAVRAVITDMKSRINSVKGPPDPANLRVGIQALSIWADPAKAKYYEPTPNKATCSKYVADVILKAGFENRLVPRDDAWWKFGNRYPSAGEWFAAQNMGAFSVVWIIQKKTNSGDDKVTITWEQPLDGQSGSHNPMFGDIISFAGHIGVYLGTGLYVSATAPEDPTGLQPFRLVIKAVPNNQQRIYFSAE